MDAIASDSTGKNASEILRLMAQHDLHILHEKAAPKSKKGDVITLRHSDGSQAVFKSAMGFVRSSLASVHVEDLSAASFIEKEGDEVDGRIKYRLTADGRAVGLKAA